MNATNLRREAAREAEGGAGVSSNLLVLEKLRALYLEAFAHDGFAGIQVEMRILRRGQKEVILHCGKQYRFVVDYTPEAGRGKKPRGTRISGAPEPAA
ncbi:MAG: hypothetical protein LBF93_10855 [Zoogloeaceae bacterium]|jgi:hypothetical protein|nr:hypothetical protein [Zoogloeaceae bacterium]